MEVGGWRLWWWGYESESLRTGKERNLVNERHAAASRHATFSTGTSFSIMLHSCDAFPLGFFI